MPSPLKPADARLYTSKDESSISVNEFKEQETPSTPGPLFIRLIQSGSRTRARPDVPIAPKHNRRFSATMTNGNNSHRVRETENSQVNMRLTTNCENRTIDDISYIGMNTKTSYTNLKPRSPSPPQKSARSTRSPPKTSRSPSPRNEVKLFGERQRSARLGEANMVSFIPDYEQKYAELSGYVQKQVRQVSRIAEIIQRDQEGCDMFQLRILMDDLGLTTMTVSKYVKEGLLDVNEVIEGMERVEQRHRQEIYELNQALEQNRSALRGGKEENQEKLEELLGYIESLKGKPSVSVSNNRRSHNEELRWKQKEQADQAAQELEMEKLRENVTQLRGVISSLEMQVKELRKENQCYKEENSELKEGQAVLKREAEMLRREAEVLKNDLNAVLLTQEREEREEQRREAGRVVGRNSRSRQNSPGRDRGLIKKVEVHQVQDADVDSLKTEVEYLKYKANTLSKDNEDLIKRLTDKVLIEREMKVLGAKNQELMEIVKGKNKEVESMWKVIKEMRDKFGSTVGMICKQNGLEEKGREGKLRHW